MAKQPTLGKTVMVDAVMSGRRRFLPGLRQALDPKGLWRGIMTFHMIEIFGRHPRRQGSIVGHILELDWMGVLTML